MINDHRSEFYGEQFSFSWNKQIRTRNRKRIIRPGGCIVENLNTSTRWCNWSRRFLANTSTCALIRPYITRKINKNSNDDDDKIKEKQHQPLFIHYTKIITSLQPNNSFDFCFDHDHSSALSFSNNFVLQAKVITLDIGFTIAFGSMFSKTWRVHRITRKIRVRRRVSNTISWGVKETGRKLCCSNGEE